MEKRYGAPVAGAEKEVLEGFLDHYRGLILELCRDLSEVDLRRSVVGSGTTLLGIVKHLAYVELGWFVENVGNQTVDYPFPEDDPDADFRIEDDETSEEIFELYRTCCERARAALAAASLDDPVLKPESQPGLQRPVGPSAHDRGDRASRGAHGHHPGAAGRLDRGRLRLSRRRSARKPRRG